MFGIRTMANSTLLLTHLENTPVKAESETVLWCDSASNPIFDLHIRVRMMPVVQVVTKCLPSNWPRNKKKLSSGDGALCTHESLRVFSGTKQNVHVLAKWWMRTMAIVSKIDNLSFVRNFHCPNDDDDDGVGNGQPVCWVEASTLHAAVMLAWADNVEQALWLWI